MKCTRKPAECSAWQWKGYLLNPPAWLEQAIDHYRVGLKGRDLLIKDNGNRIKVSPGDWVVKEPDRGIVGISESRFDAIYEVKP